MPIIINNVNIRANGVEANGNIDIGAVLQNSHTANSKVVGANIGFGDFSPVTAWNSSGVWDTDFSDQDQIANPSLPVANQF